MKKITLLVLSLLLASTAIDAQGRGKKNASPFIEGVQKVRESDYATFQNLTQFSSKEVKDYFTPFDYGRFAEITRSSKPDWGDLKPVMNYLEKVSRATMTMCAVYAINPELAEGEDMAALAEQGRREAKQALDLFEAWKTKKEWRNKMQFQVAQVDYHYFKGANYYNERRDENVIHVGLILYFGSKKHAIFTADTSSRTFRDIRFFPNDATIVASWESYIDEIADYLKENDRKGVLLTGYADNRGTDAYCIGLSRQRANEVKKALQMRGIDPQRIEVVAKGDEDPLADNTGEDFYLNNRVSITIQ